jgi:hypothetical protein
MKMLWYKAWLETRWRILMPLAVVLFSLFTSHNNGQILPGQRSVLNVLPFFWMLVPLMIAGAGINTETPFRIMKGVNGSTAFTLSLPVSRFRLFAARAVFGMMMTAGFIVAVCGLAWLAFPEVKASVSLNDGLGYLATSLFITFAVFGLATLFATFLDQQMRIFACFVAIFALRWLFTWTHVPEAFDIFRMSGEASPLITHVFPWAAVSLCFGLGTLFLLAAIKIIQLKEY